MKLTDAAVVRVAPQVSRRNLCTNPSFETNVSGWAGSQSTVARDSSAGVYSGAYSLRVVVGTNGLGDVRASGGTAGSIPFAMVPGRTYTVSAYITTPAVHTTFDTSADSRQRRIMVFTSKDGNASYVQNFGPQGANVVGQQRISHTFTVPANTVGLILGIGCAGSATDDQFVTYLDGVLIEEGNFLGSYFDGATAATATDRYAWTGTAHGSVSTVTPTGARVNLAAYPNGVAYAATTSPELGWRSDRSTTAGTYSLLTGLTGTPFGVTTAARYTLNDATTLNNRGFNLGLNPDATSANAGAPGYPVTPGHSLNVSALLRFTGAATPVEGRIAVRFANAAGVWLGAALYGQRVAIASGSWVRVTHRVTVPDGAAVMGAMANVVATGGALGDTLDGTGLLVERARTLESYFDGGMPDNQVYDYSWNGTANASPSTLRLATVRTNLITNPSVVATIAPWTVVGSAVLTYDTTESYSPPGSLRVSCTVSQDGAGIVLPVQPSGADFVASARVKAPAGTPMRISMRTNGADATYNWVADGTWQFVTSGRSTSATTAPATVAIYVRTQGPSVVTFWVDQAKVEQAYQPLDWFDGSRPRDARVFAWTGAANASTSTATDLSPLLNVQRAYLGTALIAHQRVNLCTNPNFIKDITGWASYWTPSVAWDGTDGYRAPGCTKVTKTSGTQQSGRSVGSGSAVDNPLPNTILHARFAYKTDVGLRVRSGWRFDSGGGQGAVFHDGTGQWEESENYYNIGPSARSQYLFTLLAGSSTDPIGSVFSFDDVLIEYLTTGPYFDGDTPGCRWTGITGASQSTHWEKPVWAT